MQQRIDVGVVGATGTVGRRLLGLLHDHPWFRVAEVGSSPDSAGRLLGDVCDPSVRIGDEVAALRLKSAPDEWSSALILSAVPASVAAELEAALAGRGHLVVSNASAYRMDQHVPLIIPEINADHVQLVETQSDRWPGAIVTNPNCSVVGLAMTLAPLHQTFGLSSVLVTTLQSISGAGRPGPSTKNLADNVIPFIAGEEEKIEREPLKILGRLENGTIEAAQIQISAHTHRVPVPEGHQLAVSVKLRRSADLERVAMAFESFEPSSRARLPSAPSRPLRLLSSESRPQPRLDLDEGDGMTVSVGRLRRCNVLDVRFSLLVHNLVRGAAGAALLNAELCHATGLTRRPSVG